MTSELKNKLWDVFRSMGQDALVMNHYDLAENSPVDDIELWKEFLLIPDVSEWLKSELSLIKQSELNKMVKGISKSRSVGQAQLINAFSKMGAEETTKTGPAFIYMYVPLSSEQEQAENVVKLDRDPFMRKENG